MFALAFGTFACSVSPSQTIIPGGSGGSGTGGVSASGGVASGGTQGSGGTTANGGTTASGGTTGKGGTTTASGGTGAGGTTTSGGTTASGGTTGKGGTTSSGGTSAGGSGGQAGRGSGGTTVAGTGGTMTFGTGGKTGGGTGGKLGTGGTSGGGGSTSTSTTPIDLNCDLAMPTSGGKSHSGNSQGGTGNLAWQIWSNQGTGTLTTFDNVTAFSSGWNNSGNYLGRMGFEFGNAGKAFDTYGEFTAQFSAKKSGSSGGQWSYIGIYGWTTNPCIEWYIIDDSFSKMPINPGSCTNMSNSPLSIDDGKYTMCVRNTSGTGGDRCGGAANWNQYYSIRQSNRTCGTISVTKHFEAWAAAGNKMGNLLEVKILLEVGGGQGTVDFPIANVIQAQ